MFSSEGVWYVVYMDHFLSDKMLLFTDACDNVICSHGDADRSPYIRPPYGKLLYYTL